MVEAGRKDAFFMRAAYQISRSRRGRKALALVSGSTVVQRLTLGGPNPIRLWAEDAEFEHVVRRPAELSLSSRPSLFNLYQIAKSLHAIPGDVAEIGVYQGGTALLLADLLGGSGSSRQIFLFDTFSGMPDSVDQNLDGFRPGDFGDSSLEIVTAALGDRPNVHLVQGVFPETSDIVESRKFALIHVDVDIYQSVRDCCEFFFPRLVPGGAMIFDDYGFRSCPGAKRAVDEYFAPTDARPIYLQSGQAVVWCPPQTAG